MIALLMVGCASTPKKDANKNLFEQALVLQETKTSKPINVRVDKTDHVQWQFGETQYQPNPKQKRQLFLWFSQIDSNNPIVLQLGPDWMSSYKRGNNLRKMIPRGIVIEQQFDASLQKNEVIFTLKSASTSLENGGRNESSSQ
jgi:hypothetical protein